MNSPSVLARPDAVADQFSPKVDSQTFPHSHFPVSETPSAQTQRFLPWLVAIALFMENLDATVLNTAVPVMATDLGVAPLALKAVLTSYTLALAVFIPISGWMADRFGTQRIFIQAISVFALGSLLCGLSVNVPMLVVSRIIQGIGGAMMTPIARIALVRTFPRSELLRTMNYVIIPALIGPMIGPFLGGVIVHWMSWRMIFFINLPIALLGFVMGRRFMPDYQDKQVHPMDYTGFMLFGSGIALLSYALEVFGGHTMATANVSLIIALSLAALAAYGWHSRRVEAPVAFPAAHLPPVRDRRLSDPHGRRRHAFSTASALSDRARLPTVAGRFAHHADGRGRHAHENQ